LEKTYPGNSGLGAEIPAPGNSKLEFPARNSGPFIESCTTARDKGLSEKSRGQKILEFPAPEILEFPAPENSALTEFTAPYQRVAPQPFEKDLAEFSRAGNYEIFGPRKFCQTRISGPLTARCTTTFRKGLSRISKGRKFMEFLAPGNFVQGREFWPWGGISGPET
jgi:hypothetical protein